MSGEVISVLSLEGRYYNCRERAQRARDNYNIVTRVIQVYYILVPLSGFKNGKYRNAFRMRSSLGYF